MKKAFTIIELLVAMVLLAMLVAISGMVFSFAVKAQRTANATMEISAKLQTITQQLDSDFRGLRKEGEFLLIWGPSEKRKRDGTILNEDGNPNAPDQYISFDRLYFFADLDSQTYNEQTTSAGPKHESSNLALVSYIFGRDAQGNSAYQEPLGEKRLFCRTQHLISGDADLPTFPDITAWDPDQFKIDNFINEYQTMIMQEWLNMNTTALYAKYQMISAILDITVEPVSGTVFDYTGGLRINPTDPHNLFSQGVGQFHVQIWRSDLNRWFPEIDPDGDGIYNETPGGTDYGLDPSDNNKIDTQGLDGIWVWGDTSAYNNDFTKYLTGPFDYAKVGVALKFTFTLYDSNGVFKDGKTFTHIVYLQ